jgi:rubrerythrin
MRLYVLGHFVEQPGKVILTYSYQGIQAEKVLCDPNSKFDGEHSRFQAYLALGEMEQDPKGKEILAHLDQEMEKIFADLQPQWAAPARELADKYSMSYVNAVGTSTQVLAEHDELVDFYTRLGQQAKKLADMLGTSEAKPVPQPEPEIVISEPTPADTWTCPECGKVCKSNWKICPVCDTPRPEPTDDWTCPECGKVCKAKWKLCPVCDTPKPAGGAQPVKVVPTSWDCPECGKTGLKLKFKACPVCDTPRPAGLEQYLD